jgi:hypothetical protein
MEKQLTSKSSTKFAAVDSSSACVLDAGCFMIIAYRGGALIAGGDTQPDPAEQFQEPDINLALVNTSNKLAEKNYERFLTPLLESFSARGERLGELPVPQPVINQARLRDIDWLQLVRTVEEWRQVNILINKLDPGDFILRDGPLRADIRIPPELVESTLKLAAEKNIHIIGIVKRSSVPVGTGQLMPMVPAIHKLGSAEFPDKPWYTPLQLDQTETNRDPYHFASTYIVSYNPLSQFVFSTDINSYDNITPDAAFATIADLCTDPVYIGYPYPLAHIHNQVVLRFSQIEDLRYDLQSNAFDSNSLTLKDWDLLFSDFHEILDINVY